MKIEIGGPIEVPADVAAFCEALRAERDDLRRIRVLRAGGYRCGVRSPRGVLCGAPASRVDALMRYPICVECADAEAS